MPRFIRVDCDFPTHPKTLKFEKRHGPGSSAHIVTLWLWAAMHRPSGSLKGMDDEMIEAVAKWPQAPGAFVVTLKDCGFIDGETLDFRLHGWIERQRYFAEEDKRSKTRARQARFKERQKVTHGALPGNAGNAPRGEDRRGEEKIGEEKEHSAPKAARTAERDPFAAWASREHDRSEGGNGGPETWKAWGPKDWTALAAAVKRLGEDEARARWLNFLASTDPFYSGKLPSMFLSQLGKFTRALHDPKDKTAGNVEAMTSWLKRTTTEGGAS